MKKKRILALLFAGVMSLSVTGCSFDLRMNRPKTAADVIENHIKATKESQNYHVDMMMNFEIGAEGQGITLELPIKMDVSADVLDGNMHGNMGMDMEFMGQKMEQQAEVYVEKGRRTSTTYLFDEEVGHWTVSEDDNGAGTAMSLSGMDPEAFADAEMTWDSETETYTVTQSLTDFADTGDTYELLSDIYSGMAEMMDMDPDDFMDEWETAEAIWVFDKDFLLRSMDIEGCEFSDTVKEDGVEMNVTVSLALSYEFSDHGRITEDDIIIPDKVIDEAVPSVTLDIKDLEEPETDEGIDYDDPDVYMEDPLDPMFSQNPVVPTEDGYWGDAAPFVQQEDPHPAAGKDELGSIDGEGFTLQGDPWTMFSNDGWVLELDNDGEYSFATAHNTTYPGAWLYVNNEQMDHVTAEDIRVNGIWGYTVDFLNCDEPIRPDMTWNGITFGASEYDITGVYGDPVNIYNGSLYTSLSYKVDDADIEFYVTPDNGLQKISVNIY